MDFSMVIYDLLYLLNKINEKSVSFACKILFDLIEHPFLSLEDDKDMLTVALFSNFSLKRTKENQFCSWWTLLYHAYWSSGHVLPCIVEYVVGALLCKHQSTLLHCLSLLKLFRN